MGRYGADLTFLRPFFTFRSVYPSPTEQLYSQVTFPLHGLYFGIVSKADVYEKPFPVGTFNGKPAFGHVNRVHCALQWSRDLLHWEPVENFADFIPLAWQQWCGNFDIVLGGFL